MSRRVGKFVRKMLLLDCLLEHYCPSRVMRQLEAIKAKAMSASPDPTIGGSDNISRREKTDCVLGLGRKRVRNHKMMKGFPAWLRLDTSPSERTQKAIYHPMMRQRGGRGLSGGD